MADQKYQGTDPPAEKPAFLPFKKRAMAEKTLVGYNRAPESNSESDSDSSDDGNLICLSEEEGKKQTLQELQIKAFYSVLQAFTLETSTMSNKRTQIIEKLMNEWEIADETHISFADKIQKNLLTLQQMEEMQILPETPLTKPAMPSSTFVPKSGKSWGSVNPESLIGKWVRIRLPDEAEFAEYIIKAYDAKQEMHRLANADSNGMEVDDQYSWIDIREISPEDITWKGGKKPNFYAPNYSAATARRALF